ncbi:small heat shock protein [Panaeolus papilionaceus]|nr:small heat shock protein [Panaeolus papilionaceus]
MSNVFFYEPFYDVERILNEALSAQQSSQPSQLQRSRQHMNVDGAIRSFKPRMDLHENSESNTVTATFEFPGVAKEAIEIDVHNGRLTVSAETKRSDELNEHGYAVRERRFGKYSRTLQLPQGINAKFLMHILTCSHQDEEIKASMENGLLTITFPKSAPELAPKKISIL